MIKVTLAQSVKGKQTGRGAGEQGRQGGQGGIIENLSFVSPFYLVSFVSSPFRMPNAQCPR
ncbi:MAG: hypothetical protein V7L21_15470 [Nostoc sp.]|uniref:hypothetical protein n=1 Tax=Nostoc sp. TaxID=1180 RepID=UPI002FF73562